MKSNFLVFKSDPENIRLVKRWLDEIALQHGLNETIYPNILITLTEAVNNAIIHGNKCDQSKDISMWCDIRSERIKFIVRDEGDGFDWNNIPDPRTCERIQMENGRGVLIMLSLAHKVRYKKQGANVEITFKTKKQSYE